MAREVARDQKRIWAWTYDGWTFESKPPCLRCQYMYSSNGLKPGWDLHGMPRSMQEKRDALFKALDSRKMGSEGRQCGFCAETVAAAKLYVLYNGTLGFVGS
ncbi:hypothetical protein V8E54_007105 [Elaphomyces granulatus]